MPTVLLIEPEDDVATALLAALAADTENEPVRVRTASEAIKASSGLCFDVALIGPTVPEDDALSLTAELVAGCGAEVVLVSPKLTAESVRAAMRAGAADVLSPADDPGDIAAAVARVREARHRQAAAAAEPAEEEHPLGRVVTVFSTKGGVGKTVLATNIGVALAKEYHRKTVLVDLDLTFGDVGIMLGLEPVHTIFDAVQVFDRLDGDMLEGFLVDHSSGLRVLMAPTHPEDAESVTAGRIARILSLLRERYECVVIDTSPSFGEVVLAALDRSDDVYVVTMMDVASIKNTRISLQKLHQLGYDGNMVRLVLNRADSKVFLRPSEVEDAVGESIVAQIPSDLLVPRSVNKGVPVVLESPKSAVAKSMLALANDVARKKD